MLPNQSHFALVELLNACTTPTEQAALIARTLAETINGASIATAQALANLIRSTPLPDDMPLVSWPGAQRFAATICDDYAQFCQSDAGEILPKSAIPAYRIHPVEVKRDASGLWRHPLYPVFLPSQQMARTVWFASNGLDGCGTYLVEPDNATPDSYKDWEVKRPSGDKWFLLAIEPTAEGPIALWAAPIGKS